MPQIQSLAINLTNAGKGGSYACSQSLYSFLNHDKVFKLFNLESSVVEIYFTIFDDFDGAKLNEYILWLGKKKF